MRILIVSDSHGRGISAELQLQMAEVTVLSVCLGRPSAAVMASYMARRKEIQDFRPDRVVVHVGHNDIVVHRLNPTTFPLPGLLPYLIDFCHQIKEDLPYAVVYFSCAYPRTLGSQFEDKQRLAYNKLAYRFGQMVQSGARDGRYICLRNKCLWEVLRRGLEHSCYFLPDGLHLCPFGNFVIINTWIKRLRRGD
jgi:hypothetical protein